MIDEIALTLPRHATSPRRVARPAEIWRLLQNAAIQASSLHGWTAARYRTEQSALILARMIVIHHRELEADQNPMARTWVHAFHRRTLTDRELRLFGSEGPIASAQQRWAHVSLADGGMALGPAPDALIDAFTPTPDAGEKTRMPTLPKAEGPEHRFAFRCWYTWLDPLGHVNHPTYLEWCDEALMQHLATKDIPPWQLQPVAEQLQYRNAVHGDDPVEIVFKRIGQQDGAVALRFTLQNPDDGRVYAWATTIRRLADGADLAALLG